MSETGLIFIGVAVWLVGLCVGSFLNVVIYRLPRGLSVAKPARSFCPACRQTIAGYDNLPVLSWFLLRGRCRQCGAAISVQYPLVEAATGLLFALIYALLIVMPTRVWLAAPQLPTDVPMLLAWLTLAATMVVCSATDLSAYIVDTRVTNVAVGAGLLLHMLWPRAATFGAAVHEPARLAALGVLLAAIVMLWLTVWRGPEDEPLPAEATAEGTSAAPRWGAAAALLFAILGAALGALPALAPHWPAAAVIVPASALALMFLLVVFVNGQQKPADAELAAELAAEAPAARRTALTDMLWLTPMIVVGAAGWLLGAYWPGWQDVLTWSPGYGLTPVAGLALAAYGAAVAAGVGWVLRIVFTLAFGREAFGTGDIYILAAAGATAGWDIALLGLALAVGLALAGWICGLLLKSTLMVPFGPWLALGFLAALWTSRPAAAIVQRYVEAVRAAAAVRPDLLWMGAGVLLVVSAVAVLAARGVRQLIEPDDD